MFEPVQAADPASAGQEVAQLVSLDINFLPERHRGRRLWFVPLRPWLMLLSFALLLIPNAQFFQAQAARLAEVETEFSAVDAALEGYQPLAHERRSVEARITQAEAEIAEIGQAYQIVDIQLHSWSVLVPAVLSAAPEGVEITAISQSDLELTINGLARAETLPAAFADRLEALGDFGKVTIQLVARLAPEDQPQIEPTASDPETAETEADDDGSTSREQPASFRFEIRLELPAPAQATPHE